MNKPSFFFKFKNRIIRILYKKIAKPIFFAFDPETVHDFFTRVGIFLGAHGLTRTVTKIFFNYSDNSLRQKILGIDFKNPVGLAAGFDKEANLVKIMPKVGFGFMEVGSITGMPCKGNPKPRLWRMKETQGLAVYYGLKNEGCEKIFKKMKAFGDLNYPVGVSVAMTNCVENTDIDLAIKDYRKAFDTMSAVGSYITVNVSCPNAHGGQPFMIPQNLDRLLSELDLVPRTKPVFLKLSPDAEKNILDEIINVSRRHKVNGFIVSNLTKKRDNPNIIGTEATLTKGGISGKPLRDVSDVAIKYLAEKAGRDFVIIGCGGIFSAEDAYRKIKNGASLVQLVTGMIFEGPELISSINMGLSELIRKDGYISIAQAVGKNLEAR